MYCRQMHKTQPVFLFTGSEVKYEKAIPTGDRVSVFTLHTAHHLPQVAICPLFLPQHPAGAQEVSPAWLEYCVQLQ